MWDRENEVANTYDKIFKDDPLLLKRRNREKYSEALLKHLLINRTMGACEPHDLVINDEDSRKQFEEQVAPTAGPPSSDQMTDYGDSVRYREPMKLPGDLEKIAETTMASDGRLTKFRSEPKYLVHSEVDADLKRRGKTSRMSQRLRIAAVGYRVKISKLVNQGNFNEDLCRLPRQDDTSVKSMPDVPAMDQLRHTVPLRQQAEWGDTILSHIKTALGQNSHVVLLPEFALPPSDASPASDPIDERIADCLNTAPLDAFVFAGSRHEGKYNRGLVLSKAGARVDPWWHYKVAPALKLGENVLGPRGIRTPTYIKPLTINGVSSYFAFSIAVCYDAFDISMFLNLIKLSTRTAARWKSLVILVPSFNTSPDFVAMLRDLSFLARATVVYVNGLHGDAKMFICGFSVSEILDKREDIGKRARRLLARVKKLLQDEEAAFFKRVSKDAYSRRSPAEEQRVDDLDNMEKGLQAISSVMSDLEDSGGLDHLITIEALPPGRKDTASVTGRTRDDILYYNIDPAFLMALTQFRRFFFCGDRFLPKPFHREYLSTAFGGSQKKQ